MTYLAPHPPMQEDWSAILSRLESAVKAANLAFLDSNWQGATEALYVIQAENGRLVDWLVMNDRWQELNRDKRAVAAIEKARG